MTIRNTAYETTACNGFIMTKVAHAIEDAIVSGNVVHNRNNNEVIEINYTATTTPVPAFFHPMLVKNSKNGGTVHPAGIEVDRLKKDIDGYSIVVDVRSSGKYDESNMSFRIRNQYEYDFISLYGELNNFWVKDNPRLLCSVSHLPIALYSRWISENMSRRFGLNPQDQLTVAILAAFFYLSQFTNDETVDDRELLRLCGIISKSVYTNVQSIMDVINNRPYIKDISDLCSVIKEVTGNVRLENLNHGTLISILDNSWYGTNAKELVAVAIEFPPAWILLTYSSYMDRSYKNTGIAKMSIRDKKAEIDSFVKSLATLIRHTN